MRDATALVEALNRLVADETSEEVRMVLDAIRERLGELAALFGRRVEEMKGDPLRAALAAAGLVAPWMAAIGMSASSLLVVLNSARLSRRQSRTGTKPDSGSVSPDTSLATPGRQQ